MMAEHRPQRFHSSSVCRDDWDVIASLNCIILKNDAVIYGNIRYNALGLLVLSVRFVLMNILLIQC